MNIEIACQLVRETKAAWLVNDGTQEVWLPKSQCEWEPEGYKDVGIMQVPEWLAIDKGLI